MQEWGTGLLEDRPVRTTAYRSGVTAGHASSQVEVLHPAERKEEIARPEENTLALPEEEDPYGYPAFWQVVDAAEDYLRWAGTLTAEGLNPYLGWGSDHAVYVATMWALHACCRFPCSDPDHVSSGAHEAGAPGDLALPVTPRFGIFAKQSKYSGGGEGSGKTYLGEVLAALTPHPTMEVQPTGASMARFFGLEHKTVFMDEGADYLTGNQHAMSRNVLEAGYRKPGTGVPTSSTSRVWGNKVYRISNNGPMALMTMLTPAMGAANLRALMSRIIKITIEAAPPGYSPPRIKAKRREDIKTIAEYLQKVMMRAAPGLADAEFGNMPKWMSPRKRELWESLFICAAYVDANRLDHKKKPLWLPRMILAADWLDNDGASRAKLRKDWDSVQQNALPEWRTATE